MSLGDWLLLALGLVLIGGTGVFVASEFSLVNLDRPEIEARRERGETMLGAVVSGLKQTSTHLSSAQLGITLTTLLTGFTLEPALSALLGPALGWLPTASRPVVAAVLAVAVATLASMILGELIPKNFALAAPLRVAKLVLPLQLGFTAVFRPFVRVLGGSANGILRLVGIEPREELSSARTAEELRSLVRRSATEGALEPDTAKLLGRALAFAEHLAGDAMTPRPKVAAVERGESAEAVIALARSTGYSRFPVIDDDIDNVVGLVHLKQAVSVPRELRSEVTVAALQSEPLRVPETMPLDALLGELRGRGFQMAIVVDEYGGTAGVVTLEDLVEELVGEVSDEHDRQRPDVVRSRGWLTFPGALRPDELADRAGVVVPEDGPYETVGGWIMSELGRIPTVGDTVEIEEGVFRVERMDGRRVDRVRFTPRAEDTADAADAAAAAPTTEAGERA